MHAIEGEQDALDHAYFDLATRDFDEASVDTIVDARAAGAILDRLNETLFSIGTCKEQLDAQISQTEGVTTMVSQRLEKDRSLLADCQSRREVR
jgi:hypothetical protein